PYQLGVTGGSTDAAAVQLARQGVMACPVCVPLKYTHSFAEVVSLRDIENTLNLLVHVAEEY
ncbi:MAG: M42 family peptidase, partial [Anaerolineae bacterium]|nr:M42 family peptidase [Anaerolineae bacterium]